MTNRANPWMIQQHKLPNMIFDQEMFDGCEAYAISSQAVVPWRH